jgi:hypothetical protein
MADAQTRFRPEQAPNMAAALNNELSENRMKYWDIEASNLPSERYQLAEGLMRGRKTKKGTGVVGKPGFADITEAYESTMEMFPKLRSLNISVLDSRDTYKKDHQGIEHPNYILETYDAGERDNPNPGVNTIQLFKGVIKEQEKFPLSKMLAGDALHLAKDYIPEYRKLWMEFVRSLTSDQIEKSKEIKEERGDKRDFDKWMKRSWIDAIIRGLLVDIEPRAWRRKKGSYTEEQIDIGRRMRSSLQ